MESQNSLWTDYDEQGDRSALTSKPAWTAIPHRSCRSPARFAARIREVSCLVSGVLLPAAHGLPCATNCSRISPSPASISSARHRTCPSAAHMPLRFRGAQCRISLSILVTMNGVPSSKSARISPARCSTSRKKARSNVPATTAGSTRGPALHSKAPRNGRSLSSSWKFGATTFSLCHRSTKSTALKAACLLLDRL